MRSKQFCLILLLVVQSATAEAAWQHDMQVANTEFSSVGFELLPHATGVSLLANASAWTVAVDGPDAPPRWRLGDPGIGGPRFASRDSWVTIAEPIAFGGVLGECSVGVRERDGSVSLIASNLDPVSWCIAAVAADNTVAILQQPGTLTLFDAPGTRRWQVSTNVRRVATLLRSSDGQILLIGNEYPPVAPDLLSLSKFDASTGALLARWSVPSTGFMHQLSVAANGDIRALYDNRQGGSWHALRWNPSLQLQAEVALQAFGDAQTGFQSTSNEAGALTLCGYKASENAWRITRLDPTLALQWSTAVPDSADLSSCQISSSASGRTAAMLKGNTSARARALRLRADGSVLEQVASGLDVHRVAFSGDERLWVAVQGSSNFWTRSNARLLRFDADDTGIARDIELQLPATAPLLRALAALPGDRAEVVVDQNYPAPSQPQAFGLSATGIVARPLHPSAATARDFFPVRNGWVISGPALVVAQDLDGSVRWQRADVAVMGCVSDASCVRVETAGTASQVVWMDSQGNDLPASELPLDETVQRAYLDADGGLRVLSASNMSFQLYESRPLQPLQLRARTHVASFVGLSLVGTPFNQIVLQVGTELQGFGVDKLLWSRVVEQPVLANPAGRLWEIPGPGSSGYAHHLAPLDRYGQPLWQWFPLPLGIGFTVDDKLTIWGSADTTAWISGGLLQVGRMNSVGIVTNSGRDRRVIRLPDGVGRAFQIATTQADESAVIAYGVRLGEGAALRLVSRQSSLFSNGMEAAEDSP